MVNLQGVALARLMGEIPAHMMPILSVMGKDTQQIEWESVYGSTILWNIMKDGSAMRSATLSDTLAESITLYRPDGSIYHHTVI